MRTAWYCGIFILLLCSLLVKGQTGSPSIKEMSWGVDYQLHIKLSNDSNYIMDVRGLHHTGEITFDTTMQGTTYYPVALDEDFVNHIKQRELRERSAPTPDSLKPERPRTLWSALHGSLGGGYVHFVNCLMYTLESQHLNLTDPIMTRPVTSWKPKPMTETYKRTRRWAHYIPYDQKLAQREYRLRSRENAHHDLHGVPQSFIDLFLATSQRNYDRLHEERRRQSIAQIDLVRLLLGAKYLGQDQIEFIQSRVIEAVVSYQQNNLPSVIIFDDFKAAVAMSLDYNGYRIDYVVFQDQAYLSSEEYGARLERIEALIDAINDANDEVFRKRLRRYYSS